MNPAISPISTAVDAPRAADEDAALVARLRSGELKALELLMRRHNQRLFRIARSIVRDDSEAMDVVQETYVTAWYELHRFSGTGSFGAWLSRIARNDALTRLRKSQRLAYIIDDPEQTMDLESPEAAPFDELANRQLRHLLEEAIDRLPVDYRCVYVMRAVQQLSTEETASSLAVSEDLVKTRFMRARRALQKTLEGQMRTAGLDVFEFAGRRCDAVVQAVLARLSN